jgi:hypothetical protein
VQLGAGELERSLGPRHGLGPHAPEGVLAQRGHQAERDVDVDVLDRPPVRGAEVVEVEVEQRDRDALVGTGECQRRALGHGQEP